ncbi:MAG TPA: PAS domain S-box protein [Candidatus Bathyarchaeia archaeon]|nr:PAS domain S-box protein [Candidatus Bathyarchaeia archaeon]
MSTDVLAGGWARALGGDRKQFNMFIEKMLDGFAYHKIVLDKAGKPVDYIFLEVNHAFEKMTGLKRERIIGKKVTDVLVGIEKDPADWIGVYGKVALTGEPVEFENHAEPLGKWYRISAYCPEKGYFVALIEDISERKKAVYELWQAKKDWERTFDSVPDFVAILDNHHRIVRANLAMAQQLGVTPEKAIGLFCYECVHGLDSSPDFCPHAQTVKDGKEHQAEVHEPRLGGDFLVSTTPLRDEKGNMIGSVHIARNITERKKAEEALRASEERYRHLLQYAPAAIYEIDFTGPRFKSVNDAMCLMSGYTREELLEMNPFDALDAESLERFKERIRKALAGEKINENVEYKAIRKDGRQFWVTLNMKLMSQNGIFYGAQVISHDITGRKKAEEELTKSNEREYAQRKELEALMETVPASIWITHDPECLNMTGNKATYDLLGLPPDANVSETAPEEQRPTSFLAYNSQGKPISAEDLPMQIVARTGKPLSNSEFEFRFKDGRSVWVYGNVTPLHDAEGNPKGAVGAYVDITQIKQMQIKLEEYGKNLEKLVEERTKKLELSSLYARNLIEASLDPLVTISVEGKITDVNKATELVTGCSRKELIGSDFSDYFTEPEKAKIGYKQVFTEGFVRDYPLAIKHKSGKIIDVLYNASLYTNSMGEVQGVFAAARDITDRKQAEQKLKDAERLANIGATAGMVGHDIRNPLQAITGDLYLAKTELTSTPESEEKNKIEESLTEIERNIDYINKIAQDLQDYARPLNPTSTETDLKLIIDKLLQKNGLAENVKLSVKIEDEAKKIVADADYLNRIIYNLVTNAAQAMPKGGKLTIRVYKEAKDIVITVKDTGVGIPEAVKGKLFTPMFTTKAKGQGFGLAVVKRMTESLGGTVSFESQEGAGTTFKIRLPQNPFANERA